MTKKIFITGGAGFIGSHTCVEILKRNHDVVVFDSLVNSSFETLSRIERLAAKKFEFIQGDIRDLDILVSAMNAFKPSSVIHFAGLKSVNESVINPLEYYDVNVKGAVNILVAMSHVGCNEIVFSSSATVYGTGSSPPYSERDITDPVSPYGRSKLIFENILEDWANSVDDANAISLRYFNPVGAHSSGLIGESPKDTPNNLMPLIAQTAQGKRPYLSIYGDNYETIDGTGERDYIHVTDLANGHLKAIEQIKKLKKFEILNLGTGKSTSVKELVRIFEKVNNVKVPTKVVERRAGDIAKSYADCRLAFDLIGFQCTKSIDEMCSDTWNWITLNPNGYTD